MNLDIGPLQSSSLDIGPLQSAGGPPVAPQTPYLDYQSPAIMAQ